MTYRDVPERIKILLEPRRNSFTNYTNDLQSILFGTVSEYNLTCGDMKYKIHKDFVIRHSNPLIDHPDVMNPKIMKKKIVLYTCVYDGYDNISLPVQQTIPCDFLCFTDDKELQNIGYTHCVFASRTS